MLILPRGKDRQRRVGVQRGARGRLTCQSSSFSNFSKVFLNLFKISGQLSSSSGSHESYLGPQFFHRTLYSTRPLVSRIPAIASTCRHKRKQILTPKTRSYLTNSSRHQRRLGSLEDGLKVLKTRFRKGGTGGGLCRDTREDALIFTFPSSGL